MSHANCLQGYLVLLVAGLCAMSAGSSGGQAAVVPLRERVGCESVVERALRADYARMKKIPDVAYLCAWRFGDDAKTPHFIPNPMPAGATAAGVPR